MNFILEKEKLTLYFEGELNSYNAEDVEKEIDSIVKKNSFKTLVLDFEKLNYISSAGLRIVVRLKQQFDDTSIVKVQDSVFEILEMVGFEKIVKISKAK